MLGIMDPDEDLIHSFVIKVWIEETVEEAGRARWRGHITHVRSGERRYLEKPGDIVAFIAIHLRPLGVRFGGCSSWGGRLATALTHLHRFFSDH